MALAYTSNLFFPHIVKVTFTPTPKYIYLELRPLDSVELTPV